MDLNPISDYEPQQTEWATAGSHSDLVSKNHRPSAKNNCDKQQQNNSSQQPATAARYPENTGHSPNFDSMLGQRRRRWSSIKTACGECILFPGIQRVWVWVRPDKFKINQSYYHIVSVQISGYIHYQWYIIKMHLCTHTELISLL